MCVFQDTQSIRKKYDERKPSSRTVEMSRRVFDKNLHINSYNLKITEYIFAACKTQ